jgi:hypothetical protein
LFKSKILANSKGLVWNGLKTKVSISEYGLKATNNNPHGGQFVFATEGYAISGAQSRNLPFPGTIFFYFEVTFTTAGW